MAIYLQDIEDWAISQQQELHFEALSRFGERVILKRRWQTEDHKSGLVSRCTQCSDGRSSSVQSRVASVYKQAGDSQCGSCYGTGFQSGFIEPSVITYILASDDPNDIMKQKSGERIANDPNVQFPHLPLIRQGDIVIRFRNWISALVPGVEEERYVTETPQQLTLRTGIESGNNRTMIVGFSCRIKSLPREHAYYAVPL